MSTAREVHVVRRWRESYCTSLVVEDAAAAAVVMVRVEGVAGVTAARQQCL